MSGNNNVKVVQVFDLNVQPSIHAIHESGDSRVYIAQLTYIHSLVAVVYRIGLFNTKTNRKVNIRPGI